MRGHGAWLFHRLARAAPRGFIQDVERGARSYPRRDATGWAAAPPRGTGMIRSWRFILRHELICPDVAAAPSRPWVPLEVGRRGARAGARIDARRARAEMDVPR